MYRLDEDTDIDGSKTSKNVPRYMVLERIVCTERESREDERIGKYPRDVVLFIPR